MLQETQAIDFIRMNAMLSGLVITFGLYNQALKIFRTRSASDLSAVLIGALMYNEISWLTYGIGILEWPIVAITVLALPAEIAMVIGFLKFRQPLRKVDSG